MEKKKCTKCHKTKALRDFYLLKSKCGYTYKSWCKACFIQHMREKRNGITPEKKKPLDFHRQEYQRMYYRQHKADYVRHHKMFITRHPNYFKERYARIKAEKALIKSALTEGDLHDELDVNLE